MNQCYQWPISICSWSLRNDFDQINQLMQEMEVRHVHLDLRPICIDGNNEYLQAVQDHDWSISATMIGFEQEDYSTLETLRKQSTCFAKFQKMRRMMPTCSIS